jgi:hypothetical protein
MYKSPMFKMVQWSLFFTVLYTLLTYFFPEYSIAEGHVEIVLTITLTLFGLLLFRLFWAWYNND